LAEFQGQLAVPKHLKTFDQEYQLVRCFGGPSASLKI